MAFQAEQVDVTAAQQPWIGRSVRRVTCYATFSLDRRVLKCERAGLVRVAVEAELVLRGRGAQLMRKETAVRVVAVAAGHKSFIHLVVERLGEIRLHVEMAGVAKLRLCRLQQLGLYLGSMN